MKLIINSVRLCRKKNKCEREQMSNNLRKFVIVSFTTEEVKFLRLNLDKIVTWTKPSTMPDYPSRPHRITCMK